MSYKNSLQLASAFVIVANLNEKNINQKVKIFLKKFLIILKKSKACPDIYRELSDLTSQVQMMSDSLAACRKMSKYRPTKKVHDVPVKAEVRLEQAPQTSVQVLLRPEERILEFQPTDEEKDVIISYMLKGNRKPRCLQTWRYDSLEKISGKSASEDESESCRSERFCQELESQSSSLEDFRLRKRNSKAGVNGHLKVEPNRLIEIIQRELKTLMDLAPPVAVLVAALSDTLFHYKACSRCREKISSSLPWILNRIQKLIKYVIVKRRGTFCWPNDYECLQFEVVEPTFKGTKKAKKDFVELEPVSAPEEPSKQIGKLEKVDATAVSEDRPGVQILLEIKPERKKKRFFDRAGRKYLGNLRANFPAVQLKEPVSALVVQVLKPSPKPKVLWDNKREVSSPRELSYKIRLVVAFPFRIQACFLVTVPKVKASRILKSDFFVNSAETFQKQILQANKSLVTVLVPRIKCKKEEKAFRRCDSHKQCLDEKKSFAPRDLLANAPGIVQDLLKEAEEERMQIQKVKELESQVKGLKDLMLDVHKNQMELSKVLLEKGVYSQSIIKLTDPNMLEEESRAVRKVAEIEIPGQKTFPVEALQTTVGDLKEKCILKNKMIMTLLKGLRSDVPKEWWEEIMNSTFDESKPIEEFDSEKVSDFIRQASLFFVNSEKASRVPLPVSRAEELPSEEEPNMKGIVGVDVHDGKITDAKGATWLSNFEEFLDRQSPMRSFAFPEMHVPESIHTSIGLLENQISLLNMENEKLWHEVHELRNLLKGSVKELHERKRSVNPTSDRQLSDSIQTSSSKKAINLTIQIASEKDFRRFKDVRFLKVGKPGANSFENGFNGVSKSSPIVRCTSAKSSNEKQIDPEKFFKSRTLSELAKDPTFRSYRQSEVDLNRVDDLYPAVFANRQDNAKLKALLRERAFEIPPDRSMQQAVLETFSNDVSQSSKPVVWVSSKDETSEVSDGCQAGPSQSHVDLECLLRNPSLMSQSPWMSNERELQPILENDNTSSDYTKCVNQTIQQLRSRVRSIHKDVTVLKSKNDRIDKLLERLLDDAADNRRNCNEVENDLNSFKSRLA